MHKIAKKLMFNRMFCNYFRSLVYKFYVIASILNNFGKGGYFCPCCNKKIKYYIPYGTNRLRMNAECPICRAAERDRLEILYYQRENIIKGNVLHFAPEKMLYLYLDGLLSESVFDNYMTVDIDENAYGVKQKEDICQLSFNNNVFDLIICNHVLEHVKDDEKAIRELNRVLKPNGYAIITLPIDTKNNTFEESWINTDELRIKFYGEANHVRMNGIDFEDKLKRNGMIGRKVYADSFLSKNELNKAGLKAKEFFFLCTKA